MLFGKNKKTKELSWHDYTKDVLIAYLEERYEGIKFEPIALYPDYDLIDFRAYPKGGTPEKDVVYVRLSRDEKTKEVVIEDTYFFEKIRDEYEKELSALFAEFFQTIKFFCERTNTSYTKKEVFESDYTWDEVKKRSLEIRLDVVAFTEDEFSREEFQQKHKSMIEKMRENNMFAFLRMYHLNNNCLENVNANNFREYRLRHLPEIGCQVRDKL